MALTVSEKQHWKERIARKISLAVDALLEKNNPNFMKEVAAAALKEAAVRLGIAELIEKGKGVALEIDRLSEAEEGLKREVLAAIRGVAANSITNVYAWDDEVDRALKRTQHTVEQELLAADVLGRQVLKLRIEEEELLDTVWLATSPQQIRSLWQSVAELLAGEVTPLQQHALSRPVPESSAD